MAMVSLTGRAKTVLRLAKVCKPHETPENAGFVAGVLESCWDALNDAVSDLETMLADSTEGKDDGN